MFLCKQLFNLRNFSSHLWRKCQCMSSWIFHCISIYLVIASLSLEKKSCGKLRQKLFISEIKIDLKAGDRKQKKSQLHEKRNEKLWSCGADGWRGGVWKADGRGRSISLFQLLAGTNTDDKVATLSLFCPLSLALCLAFHVISPISGSLHSSSTTSLVATLHVLCDIC